jgi:hypothetical protein
VRDQLFLGVVELRVESPGLKPVRFAKAVPCAYPLYRRDADGKVEFLEWGQEPSLGYAPPDADAIRLQEWLLCGDRPDVTVDLPEVKESAETA